MYRIRVVPLFIPPLSERTGDIEALIWHFIDKFNERSKGRTVDGLSESAMRLLLEYSWPGNIRELLNVIEYVFAVGEGNIIDASELPPELRGEQLQSSRRAGNCAEDDERARIQEALRDAGGQRSRAAELLGISRSTLWRRLRKDH